MKAFKKIHFKDSDLSRFQNNVADKLRELSTPIVQNENESSDGGTFFGREVFERSFNFSGSETSTFSLKTIQSGLIITEISQTFSDGTNFFSNTANIYFRYVQASGLCQVVVSSGTVKRASVKIKYIKKAV